MPRRKFIDKKNATTFQLVHRAQDDPRIHDADAPNMVFKEVSAPNMRPTSEAATSSAASQYSSASTRSKIKSRRDLEDEFGDRIRNNEGEAANYGVYFDDTEYDYMQHMRDLGTGGGEAFFVEAQAAKKGKGKGNMSLEDALRNASLNDRQSDAGVSVNSSVSRSASDVFGEDMAPSEFVRKMTYQDQQNIPDAIAGFQPDMDPRLREALEALEDEAYVDDEDDIFGELAEDGIEVSQGEWEASGFDFFDDAEDDHIIQGDEDDEGWESDDTIKGTSPKPPRKGRGAEGPTDPSTLPAPDEAPAPATEGDNAWLDEFNKFKKDVKAAKAAPKPAPPSDLQSSVLTGASALTAGGRRKKRKGALTSTSGYSMSSSALQRTETLTLLDQRFDKIEEEYAAEDFPDDMSMMSGMSKVSGLSKMSGLSGVSGMSEAPPLRSDFDSIMDDFLGDYSMAGKRRVKRGKPQSGMEQLDEVRKGLGPARVKTQKA